MSLRPVLRILGSVQSLFVKQFFFQIDECNQTPYVWSRLLYRSDYYCQPVPPAKLKWHRVFSRNCFLVEGMESPPYLSS